MNFDRPDPLPSPDHSSLPRRSFLQSMLLAGLAPSLVPSSVLGQNAPSKRITLGFIGVGQHGVEMNLANFLPQDDCRVLAVCDVFADRRAKAKAIVDSAYGDTGCRSEEDFRALIEDPSLDALVISTPDHWHTPMSVLALAAGKDVFCEKPTLTIAEGRELIEAVKRNNAVFQAGIEDRSLAKYHKIVEWVRNGEIGQVYKIDVTMPKGDVHPWEPAAPVPPGLNYDLWLGPAPYHPYTPTRTKPMHWRYIRDYANGMITDWGAHMVDTAQLGANAPGACAVEVEGTGEMPPGKHQSDLPPLYDLYYRYANGVEMRVRNEVNEKWITEKTNIRFEGTKGWVGIKGWEGEFVASDPKILRTRYGPGESRFWPRPPIEQRNFLDCVKSRKPTSYTAEALHHLCVTLHMGVIAIDLGRKLRFDQQSERFIDDEEANQRLSRVPRTDWLRS